MPSIGRWQVTQWDSGLTVGVQTKVMTLLQNTEKKEDWSFKRYEMIKWIFCYATLIIEILLIAAAYTDLFMTSLKFLMIHKQHWTGIPTFSNLF